MRIDRPDRLFEMKFEGVRDRLAARRMGENDAWLEATAQSIDADLVGADRAAFERLGPRYLRFR